MTSFRSAARGTLRSAARGTFRSAARPALLALLVLLLGVGHAGAATATPEPGPTLQAPPVAEGVPEQVAQWFRTEADDVIGTQGGAELELDADQRAAVELGLVRTVTTWSAGFRGTGDPQPPLEATLRWISPLSLDGEGIGVLVAGLDGGGTVDAEQLRASPDLADALLALAPERPVVHDVPLDAWFTVTDAEVLPLDDAARASLAGAVPVEVYRPFVQERYAASNPNHPGSAVPEENSWAPAAWVAAALLLLLGWAGVVVWLRRENEAADVGEHRPRTRSRSAAGRR